MKTLSNIIFLVLVIGPSMIFSQSILGTWKTVDDEDGKDKSKLEIYEENGKVYGKVIELLDAAEGTHCEKCKGDLKDAPITGMVLLNDMEWDGESLDDGSILDPKSGKTYSCSMELEEPNKLKVRGYIGFSLIGRTQYWYRVTE